MWDEKSGEYEEYMEILADEMDFSQFIIVNNKDEPVVAESVVLITKTGSQKGETHLQKPSYTVAESDTNTGFNPSIAITGGIAMISLMTCLIVARRKKKTLK